MIIDKDELISNPQVSVVICSYNRSNTILQAIDSVLNQVCDFPFEIIIGDDGSTDNSRQLLLEYQNHNPEKIVLLFQDVNLGLGANWASCIKLSRANYIASLDDDDYWCDNSKLQKQVNFLKEHPEYGLIHTNYYNFYVNTGRKILANPDVELNSKNLMQQIFTGRYLINTDTVCFKKDLLSGYLDYYIVNKFPIQDWPTWLILSKNSKFMYLDTPTVIYRKFEGNMSNPTSYEKIIRKYKKEKMMYKIICNLFPNDLPFDERGYDTYIYGILLNLAYKKRDYKSARQYSGDLTNLGACSLKIKTARNPVFFHLFWLFKKIKSVF